MSLSNRPPTPAHEWFAKEVQPHGPQLKSWLRGQFPSVHDVDDVVQESYLRIWKAKAAQPIQSAKAFLFKVARHLALDTLRKGRNAPIEGGYDFAASRVLDTAPNAAQALLNEEICQQLAAALVALPERYRNVIVLHKLQGLSHREIAARLNLTEKTSQKYSSLALERCAAYLHDQDLGRFHD